jgi:hypothetical protein
MAMSSESLYTAASSDVSKPTNRFGSSGGASPESESDRTAGPILAAQPHVLASPVSVFFLKNSIYSSSKMNQKASNQKFSSVLLHQMDTVCKACPEPFKE